VCQSEEGCGKDEAWVCRILDAAWAIKGGSMPTVENDVIACKEAIYTTQRSHQITSKYLHTPQGLGPTVSAGREPWT
jgi:hypothetical protein